MDVCLSFYCAPARTEIEIEIENIFPTVRSLFESLRTVVIAASYVAQPASDRHIASALTCHLARVQLGKEAKNQCKRTAEQKSCFDLGCDQRSALSFVSPARHSVDRCMFALVLPCTAV